MRGQKHPPADHPLLTTSSAEIVIVPLKIRCPKCRKVLKVSDNARGKAVRCPDCETKIRVPSGDGSSSSPGKSKSRTSSKRRRSSRAASDSGDDLSKSTDMLATLDLRKAAASGEQICSKCGTELDPEDTECPNCGVDPTTGRIRAETLARMQRKGPDPAKFFQQARRDAWNFLLNNMKFAVRTSVMAVIFSMLGFFCFYMAFYSSGSPPKYFWGFIGLALFVMPPGWAWHLCVNIINLTIAKKSKLKKVNTDIFLNSALGLKHILWYVIFAAPMLAVVGGACTLFYFAGLPSYVSWAMFAAGNLIILPLLPIVMIHMTMPITSPGWKLWKIMPVWYRNPFPSLYWLMWSILAFLPIIALLGSIFIFQYDIGHTLGSLNLNSEIEFAEDYETMQEDEELPDWVERLRKVPPVQIDHMKLLIPGILWISAMALVGFPAVFTMRMNGLFGFYFKRELELISEEEEYKYVPKEINEDEAPDAPIPARKLAVIVLLMTALSFAFGSVYGVISGSGAVYGMATGLSWAGWLISFWGGAWFLSIVWEDSIGWLIGCIIVPFVSLVYIILNWDETKRPFFVNLSGIMISVLAFFIFLAGLAQDLNDRQRGPVQDEEFEVEEGDVDDEVFIAPELNIASLPRFNDLDFHLTHHV